MRSRCLGGSLRDRRPGAAADGFDAKLPGLPRQPPQRFFDACQSRGLRAVLTFNIIAYLEAKHQSVWPENCWQARFFRRLAIDRPTWARTSCQMWGSDCSVSGRGPAAAYQRRRGAFFYILRRGRRRGKPRRLQPLGFRGTAAIAPPAPATPDRRAGPGAPGPSPSGRGRDCCRAAGILVLFSTSRPARIVSSFTAPAWLASVSRCRGGTLRSFASAPAHWTTIRSRQ